MEEKAYYLGLSLFPGIGPKRFRQLFAVFGSAQAIWHASEGELERVVGKVLSEKFISFRKTVDLEKEFSLVKNKGIEIITWEDEEYPMLLRVNKHVILATERSPESLSEKTEEMLDTASMTVGPFLLYVKGNVSLLNSPKIIAIVGTRKITPYGKEVTEMIVSDLVSHDFTIVSGLALGVDAVAHKATLKNNGKIIAVLGSGVDVCTPFENKQIYDDILQHDGAIISTLSPGKEATPGTFPARNAIIAGLSLGVVVTEGAHDSGSLITAKDAQKIGRPVFAVPGPITSPLSMGSNSLLQNGAVAITKAEDVLNELGIKNQSRLNRDQESRLKRDSGVANAPQNDKQFSSEEKEIVDLLQNGSLHFDAIVRTINKPAQEVGSLLSMMELKGFIKNRGGEYSINF